MAAIFNGNPFSALWDFVVPKKALIESQLYMQHFMIESAIHELSASSTRLPLPLEEKIRKFLSTAFGKDLSGLDLVESKQAHAITSWGSLTHLEKAFIILSPGVVSSLSAESELSDKSKFFIAQAAAAILRDDYVEGAITISKQSAKWRLLAFAISAAAMSPLVYSAQSTLMRVSSLFSIFSMGSMIGSAVDYFYTKKMKQQQILEVDATVAGISREIAFAGAAKFEQTRQFRKSFRSSRSCCGPLCYDRHGEYRFISEYPALAARRDVCNRMYSQT